MSAGNTLTIGVLNLRVDGQFSWPLLPGAHPVNRVRSDPGVVVDVAQRLRSRMRRRRWFRPPLLQEPPQFWRPR